MNAHEVMELVKSEQVKKCSSFYRKLWILSKMLPMKGSIYLRNSTRTVFRWRKT